MQKFFKKISGKWKNAIYVISQIKFITELNPKFIQNGCFVVENVGMLFQNIVNIPMVARESQKIKLSSKLLTETNETNFRL